MGRGKAERLVGYTGIMTKAEIQYQALELSEPERLELAEALWASISDPDALPLPQWQRALLEERLATSESEEGRDWEEIRAEIWPPGK
jgi:putative addiction module component (TIGR02574 family)